MPVEYFPFGGWWIFPIVMPLVMLVVAITFMYLVFGRGGCGPARIHSGHGSTESGGAVTATEIIKIRYARGEITRDEFEQMKIDLG